MSPTTKPERAPARLLKLAARLVTGALFPPRCLACAHFIAWPYAAADPDVAGVERWFCEPCVAQLLPLEGGCPRCARPLRQTLDQDALAECPDCAQGAPSWTTTAAFAHEGPARLALHRLKFSEQRAAADGLGRLLARAVAAADAARSVELVVPVPLGPERLHERGYNQARLVAETLGRRLGLPVAPEGVLTRPRQSASQHRLGRQERMERGEELVFQVVKPEVVRGRVVAIVDDVMTTGATVRAAAEALEAAGAEVSWAWVWSRA